MIVNWYLSSKTGLDNKKTQIRELIAPDLCMKLFGYSGIDRKTWVLVTDLTMKLVWCLKTLALWHQPFLELKLIYQALGHHRLWRWVGNQQHFRQCTGSWGVVYWSRAGFVRRRKMASYCVCHPCDQLTQYSWKEGDGLWPYWSSARQRSRLVGASYIGWVSVSRIRPQSYPPGLLMGRFTPGSYRSCPGRRTWVLWGHTESAKEQWKNHQKLPKTIFLQLNINRKASHGKTKRSGKASLSDKQSTQQLPSYAKINLNVNW